MSQAHYIVGDVFDVLATMPDNSVDLILTSPPFLALRSYLPADHPDKAKEIGSEPSPAAFLDTLLDLTVEWRRVLAPHGSLCVELGDTYSGSGGAGGDYAADGLRDGQEKFDGSARRTRTNNLYNTSNRYSDDWNVGNTAGKPIEGVPITGGRGWPLPKSLCGIPELYRLSLAYGRNMLQPERTIEPWRVRNVIRWCRPNPPVGALGDKFRPATSDMVVACVSEQRWFDLDAVRQPLTEHFDHKQRYPMDRYAESGKEQNESRNDNGKYMGQPNPAGAPPLDWWQVSTEPYAGSHYATWPRALLTRPIQAMCPTKVCRECGEPSRRIVEQTEEYAAYRLTKNAQAKAEAGSRANSARGRDGGEVADDTFSGWSNTDDSVARGEKTRTLGWTSCDHDNWRPGRVLDPFGGSGVTGLVATGHGRDCLLIDLDGRNLELARERIGPMWFNEAKVDDLFSLLGSTSAEGVA